MYTEAGWFSRTYPAFSEVNAMLQYMLRLMSAELSKQAAGLPVCYHSAPQQEQVDAFGGCHWLPPAPPTCIQRCTPPCSLELLELNASAALSADTTAVLIFMWTDLTKTNS